MAKATSTTDSATCRINTVLFDLDGTFADTAPELTRAINTLLKKHRRDTLQLEDIRPVVSHGGAAIIRRGFGINTDHPEFEPLRRELLDVYRADMAVPGTASTQLFPGMKDVLLYIAKHNLKWGIVTNKPGWLTDPLMQGLDLPSVPTCVISGDTLPQRKPDPAPLLYACKLANSSPDETVYIGDAARDIEAGRRAGMQTIGALFGYIAEDDEPENWGADHMINDVTDIIDWLKTHVE